MNNADRIHEASRWFRYAREDLEGARSIIEQELGVARHACWLSQQAAEKAFKAVLVFHQLEFPRTHDLDLLNRLLPDTWQISDSSLDLSALAEWSVEARYPGDWTEATTIDAQLSVAIARQVIRYVAERFQSSGVSLLT